MCGIAGFYDFTRQWTGDDLATMTHRLAHRGPDAHGLHHDPATGIGLGHRRLSILDLSERANQPLSSANGRYLAIYNGEVYNFAEMRSALGLSTRTTSDTEVLIEAFAQEGPEMIGRTNGMFALAIWDTHAQALWLFRDRIGKKPLYYYWDGQRFAFASELKALRSLLPQLPLNRAALDTYLHLGYIPAPMSIWQGIGKLPQGSYTVIRADRTLTTTPFWQLDDSLQQAVITDEASAKAELDRLLRESVRYRLIADVPVGSFLSGGVDSSLVTALAQREHGAPIAAFTIGFRESKYDERPYARQVARHLGVAHHELECTYDEALAWVHDLPRIYDEPYADSSAIPTLLVSQLARQHVTVALSGDGGDELFHGYGSYAWAERLGNPVLRSLRAPLAWALQATGKSRYQRVAQLLDWHGQDDRQVHLFSQEQYFFSRKELVRLLARQPELVIAGQAMQVGDRTLTSAEAQAVFDLRYYMPDDLQVKVDRASMRHSLEVRCPLLDYRVVEFALRLHPSLKRRGGTAKYLLKQVLYDYVPQHLFERPKWGFAAPMLHWLKGELRGAVDEYLSDEAVRAAGLVQPAAVQDVKDGFYRRGQEYLYIRLWALLTLHQWARGEEIVNYK